MLLWKLIVYYLICGAVLALLYYFAVAPVVAPLLDKVLATGVLDKAYRVAVDYITMSQNIEMSITALNETTHSVSLILLENGSEFTVAYILLAILMLVGRFLLLLKELPLVELVKERMTTRQKGMFSGLFIKYLGKSCIYALTVMLFTLPIDALILFLSYYILVLFVGWMGVFGVFVSVFAILALFAVKNSFFALCLPNVNDTQKPFRGFLQGVALSARNFLRIFLYEVPFMLFLLFAVTAFTFFTFGAALPFMLPVAVVLSAIFRSVLSFSAKRQNFYVDSDTIVKGRLDNDLPDMEEDKKQDDNENGFY